MRGQKINIFSAGGTTSLAPSRALSNLPFIFLALFFAFALNTTFIYKASAVFQQYYSSDPTTRDTAGPEFIIMENVIFTPNKDAELQIGSDTGNPVTFINTNQTGTLDVTATQVNFAAPVSVTGALGATSLAINSVATLSIDGSNRLDFGSIEVVGLADATQNSGAVTKSQFDAAIAGLGSGAAAFLSANEQSIAGTVGSQISFDSTNLTGTFFPDSDLSGNTIQKIDIESFSQKVQIEILAGGLHRIRRGAVGANNVANSAVGAPNFKSIPATPDFEYDLQDQGGGQYTLIIRRATAAPVAIDITVGFFGV